MKIEFTPIELALLSETISAGMTAIIAERNRLNDLGLHYCADYLTSKHKAMNELRALVESARE